MPAATNNIPDPELTARRSSFMASGLGVALFSSAVFGLSGSFAKSLLETGWSPGASVTARLTGAALILALPDDYSLKSRKNSALLVTLMMTDLLVPSSMTLAEGLVHLVVEGNGTLQVGAERFLHDDPRALHQTGFTESLDDFRRSDWWHAHVVQAARSPAELLFCNPDGLT